METINILGVKISKVTLKQATKEVGRFLLSGRQHYIVTPNPEFLMVATNDSEFRKILNEADMAVPDGVGLLWAATVKQTTNNKQQITIFRRMGLWARGLMYGLALIIWQKSCQKVLPERVTGVDMVFEISKICEQKNCSVYLLGGEEGIAVAAALKLKQRYPKLKIAGAEVGIMNYELRIKNFEKYQQKNEDLILRINKAKPDVLFVAFGQVKQEKWIYENLKKLLSVKVAMGVGGAFDFIAGTAKRAPFLFQKLGLEWLWRLLRQPWRFNRILTATFRFAKAVIDESKGA